MKGIFMDEKKTRVTIKAQEEVPRYDTLGSLERSAVTYNMAVTQPS